ncbi:netrin receptor UNC5B-like [Ptychodera flava]|uniref:netrin receptor UNC5B-like n=1 Tax=Ptychodera flava TaxID=63121 RepID=UPI00396A9397
MADSFPESFKVDAVIVTCTICREIFRDPRILQCQHTFCKTCLDKLVGGSHEVTCPLCRHVWSLPEGGVDKLSKHFLINGIMKEGKDSYEMQTITDQEGQTITAIIQKFEMMSQVKDTWPVKKQERCHDSMIGKGYESSAKNKYNAEIIAADEKDSASFKEREFGSTSCQVGKDTKLEQDTREISYVDKFNDFAATCEIGQLFTEYNFVGSVFDDRGGYLKMPVGNVVLYIPPGAIEQRHRQPIYCYLDDFHSGQLRSDGNTLLTPVVKCGPDGTTFKTDLVLSLPHCALNPDSWQFRPLCQPSDGKWIHLPEANILVKKEAIFLFLRDFTKYAADGKAMEGHDARRRIGVGVQGQFRSDDHIQIHVGSWYDRKMMSDEKLPHPQTGTFRWTERIPIYLDCEDKQLKVEFKDLEKQWQIMTCPQYKTINVSDLGLADDPLIANCQFNLQRSKAGGCSQSPVACFTMAIISLPVSGDKRTIEFTVEKEDNKHNTKIGQLNQGMSNSDLYRQWNEDWSPLDNQIRQDTWRRLCEVLDVNRDGRSDWQDFAGHLELTPLQIQSLGKKDSPTNNLLAFFFSLLVGNLPLTQSLQKLESIFKAMQNDVACDIIRKEMTEARKTHSKSVNNSKVNFRNSVGNATCHTPGMISRKQTHHNAPAQIGTRTAGGGNCRQPTRSRLWNTIYVIFFYLFLFFSIGPTDKSWIALICSFLILFSH